MTWVRVEPDAPSHHKIQRVGVIGFGLAVAGLCYANHYLTDGVIPEHALPAVFPGHSPKGLRALADKLVEAGLWERREDGWLIHDFHRYQPTREEVLEERRLHALRSAAGGRARASVAQRIHGRFTSHTTSDEPADRLVDAGPARDVAGTSDSPAPTSPVSVPVPVTKNLEPTTLSGERPTRRANAALKEQAQEVLRWLNTKTGKNFEAIDTNLGLIEARLREGREPWQLKKIVSMKVKAWGTDPERREYLRPETLFGKKKCAQYMGEIPKAQENGHHDDAG